MVTNTQISTMFRKMSLQFNLFFWKLVPHLVRGLHWTMIRHYVKNKSWQNSAAVISSSCGEAAGVLVPVKRAVDTPRSFALQVRIHRQEDPRADIRCIRIYCWAYGAVQFESLTVVWQLYAMFICCRLETAARCGPGHPPKEVWQDEDPRVDGPDARCPARAAVRAD